MTRSKTVKISENHIRDSVNRIEFQTRPNFKDPFGRLAAAIILQAVIDQLKDDGGKFYWYNGYKVQIHNTMAADDYRFYADLAGIECSWGELLRMARASTRIRNVRAADAAVLIISE